LLGDPELYRALVRYARRRVRESEVEDIVQATLTDALAAQRAPDDPEELRRWVHTIARNKIADIYRRGGREAPRDNVGEEAAAQSTPVGARDLLRWAENELPPTDEAAHTLEWMLREGDGEKLEHIAEEANLPPPRVRQRVSRMRRYFKNRWTAQLAAAAALTALVLALVTLLRKDKTDQPIVREPVPVPSAPPRAEELRRLALERCDQGEWQPCLDGLNEARKLDPDGDQTQRVQEARAAAARGLAPETTEPESKSKAAPKGDLRAPAPDIKKMAPKPKATAPDPLRTQNNVSEPPWEPQSAKPRPAPQTTTTLPKLPAPEQKMAPPAQAPPVQQEQQFPSKKKGK
jgi:RNA polymerase sigma factor (sigma-70 family)